MTKTALLSFDIEEWFQVENLKSAIDRRQWDQLNSSVEKNTERILYLLEKNQVKATFFVLGVIAQKHPELVKRIVESGHEVASHGFNHELNSNLSTDKLNKDLKTSKAFLESLSGQEIIGYRAPSFSVTDEVVDILRDLGYIYDSSYNPFSLNSRYGKITKKMEKTDGILKIDNGLYEIPLSQTKLMGQTLPISGGAYFRLIPSLFFNNLVKSHLRENNLYNFYLHPWEFEPEQPRIRSISLNHQLRHYTGLRNTSVKLEKLISLLKKQGCRFMTMQSYVTTFNTNL